MEVNSCLLLNRKLFIKNNTNYITRNIDNASCDVVMNVGKPQRKFVVRIIDLDSNKSKNFSIYNADVDLDLKTIHDEIVTHIEKSLGVKK